MVKNSLMRLPHVRVQNGIMARLKSGFKGMFSGTGGGNRGGRGSWPFWFLPGTKFDYVSEAGDLWLNSAVMACVKWASRTFPEAPARVYRPKAGNQEEIVPNHPLTDLLHKPNPFYGGRLLWAGTLLSLMIDGNAYWLKVRSASGTVVELWYLPHFLIEPAWDTKGSEFLTHYEYKVNGKIEEIPVADIVHFRDGLDPDNYRKGLSGLKSTLREVCTDNDAATYAASILRNGGVPSVILTPKAGVNMDMDDEEGDLVAEKIQRKTTGDMRGKPLILDIPFEVQKPGFNPKELMMDKIRQVPEERVCAVLGIPPIVVGLGAGLQRSTFSNAKESREAAYESFIVPTQCLAGDTIDAQLLPDFNPKKGERLGFDLSRVRAFQEDENDKHARFVNDFRGGVATRKEAREALGFATSDKDDVYITDIQAAAQEELNAQGASADAAKGGKSFRAKSSQPVKWAARVAAEIAKVEEESA